MKRKQIASFDCVFGPGPSSFQFEAYAGFLKISSEGDGFPLTIAGKSSLYTVIMTSGVLRAQDLQPTSEKSQTSLRLNNRKLKAKQVVIIGTWAKQTIAPSERKINPGIEGKWRHSGYRWQQFFPGAREALVIMGDKRGTIYGTRTQLKLRIAVRADDPIEQRCIIYRNTYTGTSSVNTGGFFE
jgi:hypothetical protein